jgi:succinate dehydrogenase hydrophobic anchor subunit
MMIRCDQCEITVLPKADGTCPSCGQKLEAKPPAEGAPAPGEQHHEQATAIVEEHDHPGLLRASENVKWQVFPIAIPWLVAAASAVAAVLLVGGLVLVVFGYPTMEPTAPDYTDAMQRYSTWVSECLAGALGLLILVLLLHPRVLKWGGTDFSVGSLGIAWVIDGKTSVLHWCEIEQIEVSSLRLEIKGKGAHVECPSYLFPDAVRAIVKEAKERIPDRLTIEESAVEDVVAFARMFFRRSGERVAAVEADLETPRVCRATGQPVTAQHARWCAKCAEVYDEKSVPELCAACGVSLKS